MTLSSMVRELFWGLCHYDFFEKSSSKESFKSVFLFSIEILFLPIDFSSLDLDPKLFWSSPSSEIVKPKLLFWFFSRGFSGTSKGLCPSSILRESFDYFFLKGGFIFLREGVIVRGWSYYFLIYFSRLFENELLLLFWKSNEAVEGFESSSMIGSSLKVSGSCFIGTFFD